MLKEIFQVYMDRLIDLSSNNRSIFLPKLVSSQMIDLHDFHFLNNHPSFFYIEELLGRKRNIPLIQQMDARDKNVNQLSQKLKRLQQQVKFAEEETGEKNLFVGWPLIEGKLLNDQLIRCPLIFFPVSLEQEEGGWYIRKNIGDVPFLNKAFLLCYSQAMGRKLNKEWLENPLEEFSRDSLEFRSELYHYLQKELTLNFNQELFENKLGPFTDSSRQEEEARQKTGLLKLKPTAILGQFSQKSSFLISDYESLIEECGQDSLEALFTEMYAKESSIPHPVSSKEPNLYHTFPLDASQEEVMKSVRAGNSCVVEGPPGTGKSQLICNLVSDFTARGKSVLVVSQKRAALDVVYDRLGQQGFAPFTGLVHDYRADRKILFRKIFHQISSLDLYQELNRSLDAIQLERGFSQNLRIMEQCSEILEEYKQALFSTEECGIPVKKLYVTSSIKDQRADLTQYYKQFHFDRVDGFLNDFRDFIPLYKKYQDPASFWLHRVDFSDFQPGAIVRFREILEEIQELKKSAETTLGGLSQSNFGFPLIYQSYEQQEKLLELREYVLNEEDFFHLKNMLPFPESHFDLLWLDNKFETVKKLLSEDGIEWDLKDEEVEIVLQKAINVLELKGSWWRALMLRLEGKEFQKIWDLLKINGLANDKAGLKKLIIKLENRLNLNHQYTLLKSKPWMDLPEKPFDFVVFNHQAIVIRRAVLARLGFAKLGDFAALLMRDNITFTDFSFLLEELIGINHMIAQKLKEWEKYLGNVQIKRLLIADEGQKLKEINERIERDFEELVAFDKMKKNLGEVDFQVMSKLIEEHPDRDFDALKKIFLSGLKLSWIEHIEAKFPVLQDVSSARMKNRLDDFLEAQEEKLKVARFMVELRLRERTFKKLHYNRLNNLITYRELGHQVNKKKFLWSIRKVMDNFEEEVFRLVPCWLASPESVSALFPLKRCFDLVIFDESSQCFVEKGIPAMLRGKQVVIAGDSQQLQPYDLYQARIEIEEEGIDIETPSLLELCAKYFQKFNLETHYRSKSYWLIHFSNMNFYRHDLKMLSDMAYLNKKELPFELIKVDGVWDKQKNVTEAEAVIRQIKKWKVMDLFAGSIGVITFNYYQMELIQELLENEINAEYRVGIHVKNIENVQGDEYDLVIFSTGYASNPKGKFRANFGLLGKKGGENRLNVAVTRAKSRIILVTSMHSGQFSPKQEENNGVRLLKEFLQFVEAIASGNTPYLKKETPKGFELSWYLKDSLIGEYGNHVVKDSGYSKVMDLEVMEGDWYKAAILTDDDRLYAAKSAKEAFVYHAQLLKLKNWTYVYVFSRQFWLDRADLLQTKLADREQEGI